MEEKEILEHLKKLPHTKGSFRCLSGDHTVPWWINRALIILAFFLVVALIAPFLK